MKIDPKGVPEALWRHLLARWGDLGSVWVDFWEPRGAPGGALEVPLDAAGGTWGPKGTKTEPKGEQNGCQKGPKSMKKRSWFGALRQHSENSIFGRSEVEKSMVLHQAVSADACFLAVLKKTDFEASKANKMEPKSIQNGALEPPK